MDTVDSGASNAAAAGGPAFTRPDLERGTADVLHAGRWGNAEVRKHVRNGEPWVVKDFRRRAWVVRQTLGRWFIHREIHALRALRGVPGIPADAFRLDPFALCYRFVPGETLRERKVRECPPGRSFYAALETTVDAMHARGIAHLDLRNGRNLLVTEAQQPVLLDFQSSVRLSRLPRFLQRILRDIDVSGVYKWWLMLDPLSIDDARCDRLLAAHRRRHLWPFKGYRFGLNLGRERRLEKWFRRRGELRRESETR